MINPITRASWIILTSWRANNFNCVKEAIDVIKEGWPDSGSLRSLSNKKIEQLFISIGKKLPRWIDKWNRTLYRSYFERKGLWQIIESFKLE